MIALYQRTDCPFCWKVRLALEELGLAYACVDIRLGETHPVVLRLSPTGSVPVLVDGEVVIWESGIALDYLDARYRTGSLIPIDPVKQAWVRTLHAYSDRCIGSALRSLVFEKRSKYPSDWDQDVIQIGTALWLDCQAWLEDYLKPEWLGGEALSVGECALATRCGVAQAYGVVVSSEFPVLFDWYLDVKARPAWKAAYPDSFPVEQEVQAATHVNSP